MPRRHAQLSLIEVEFVAHCTARKLLQWDEPIPDFSSRYPHVLESCIATPFQTYGKKDLYPELLDKAAALFYLMIKNHPFANGNKRIAIVTTLYFLLQQKKWLRVDQDEFYGFAKWIAASNPKVRTQTIAAIKHFMGEHLIQSA